jgi:2-polyprenyl-3-methyl-5-hydroxy-6-metoxy-1,4-benzoquinol methylase
MTDNTASFSPSDFLARLSRPIFDERFEQRGTQYFFEGREIPCRNGILRFTPDDSYSSGNFQKLRDMHGQLQLDSATGTDAQRKTILERTNWPAEFFKDKLILECGCGAGPDTEALVKLGAIVVSVDIAGVDVAKRNVGSGDRNMFVQASIMDLPFRKESFDIVYCHRVLQHTPDPEATLKHILQYVKPDGDVFVHSYARSMSQMWSWKYALRPLTKRMSSESLYKLVAAYTPPIFYATNAMLKIPPRPLGHFLSRAALQILPVRNPTANPLFAGKSSDYLLEYAIHNTFDALAPPYDSPVSTSTMFRLAKPILKKPFEVWTSPSVTLLRSTRPDADAKPFSPKKFWQLRGVVSRS